MKSSDPYSQANILDRNLQAYNMRSANVVFMQLQEADEERQKAAAMRNYSSQPLFLISQENPLFRAFVLSLLMGILFLVDMLVPPIITGILYLLFGGGFAVETYILGAKNNHLLSRVVQSLIIPAVVVYWFSVGNMFFGFSSAITYLLFAVITTTIYFTLSSFKIFVIYNKLITILWLLAICVVSFLIIIRFEPLLKYISYISVLSRT